MHPAEHRAYRELHAGARQLERHWSSLADRLAGTPQAPAFRDGAKTAAGLLAELDELTEREDLYGRPAAQGVGATLSGGRTLVSDRFLERNQAARLAVLDAQHLTTLLPYLARLARTRGDEEHASFCEGWLRRMQRVERAARTAAIECGERPDEAIERADQSPLGAAAHGVAYAVGTVGEWTDRRLGRLKRPDRG